MSIMRRLNISGMDLNLLVSIDALLGEKHASRGLRSEDVLADGFCCVVRRGHPGAGKRLTLERYVETARVGIHPSVEVERRAIPATRLRRARGSRFVVARPL